ncbi:putative membrane protein [Helicobacter pylori NQ4099]|uniref:Membrane protein n=2 Tax=Helicobacter pylori TaxID=210 RepID=T2SKC0_HELPX|nr:putative membrane protein [Helicobacter pylori NQ4099]EQD92853.1 membrane protein [Helicobacter pylori PZ5080]KHL81044.1 membrane protein [Helicobacter pylori]
MTFGAFYFLSFQFFNLVLVLVKLKVLRGFVVGFHHAP